MALYFKKEVGRKLIHVFALLFIVLFAIVSNLYGRNYGLLSLVLLLIVFLVIEFFRVEFEKKIPFLSWVWRKKEKKKIAGYVYFLIGTIIVLAIFDYQIALAALLMTTFGDIAAALIGKKFGRTWLSKERALEGILAEFAVDLIIGFIVLESWVVVLVMAIVATIVETLLHKLDDNLIVPIFAGFAGQISLLILNSSKL